MRNFRRKYGGICNKLFHFSICGPESASSDTEAALLALDSSNMRTAAECPNKSELFLATGHPKR